MTAMIPDKPTRQALEIYEMATRIVALASVWSDSAEAAASWLESDASRRRPDDAEGRATARIALILKELAKS